MPYMNFVNLSTPFGFRSFSGSLGVSFQDHMHFSTDDPNGPSTQASAHQISVAAVNSACASLG
jgi:hypothetical protein